MEVSLNRNSFILRFLIILIYWVDKKVMRNFKKFFSTYAIKDNKQHKILIQNGSFSLITFKLKSFKSIKIDIF